MHYNPYWPFLVNNNYCSLNNIIVINPTDIGKVESFSSLIPSSYEIFIQEL